MAGSQVSFRVRLTLLTGLVAAVVFTAGAVFLYAGLSRSISDAVTTELRVRALDARSGLSDNDQLPTLGGFPTQVLTAEGEVIEPEGQPAFLQPDEVVRAADAEVIVDREVARVGEHARVLGLPAQRSDGTKVVVAVAGSTAPVERARARLALVLGVAGPVIVLLVMFASWAVIGATLRPVRRMTRRAATLSIGEGGERLPQPPGGDEIAELGATLNQMLDRISETMAHERAFIDDASHELRTPVSVLRGELELALLDLRETGDATKVHDALASAIEETDRLSALTDQLLMLARADAGSLADHQEPVDLLQLAAKVGGWFRSDPVVVDITGDEIEVMGNETALEQAVTNLVANAMRWARTRVEVRVEAVSNQAVVAVSDDGPGFEASVLDRVLDRFVQGDSSRNRDHGGAGLGLAIVVAVSEAHGGRLEVTNGPPLGGASVRLHLPLAEGSGEA